MTRLTVNRRSDRIALLSAACDARAIAQVTPRDSDLNLARFPTRMAGISAAALHLDPQTDRPQAASLAGVVLDVSFEHLARRYVFTTTTRMPAARDAAAAEDRFLHLALPACVERIELRRHPRLRLPAAEPIHLRMRSVAEPPRELLVRLTDLSAGGLGGVTVLPAHPHIRAGELYSAVFALPGEPRRFEFVVRVAHVRQVAGEDAVRLGCAFQPGDDDQNADDKLHRIERFLARRSTFPGADSLDMEGHPS
jgi:hypothetical protein